MANIPKYLRIINWVNDRIDSGLLRVGDRLETEAEISEIFNFSRQTVRQALSNLEQEGTISRIQGSGSYIKNAQPKKNTAPVSQSVTIISSYADSYIFPRILQSMAETLQKAGYSTRIMFTNNRRETERKILKEYIQNGSRDPLIAEPVTSALPNPNLPIYKELREGGTPILFFNTYYPNINIPHVSLDDVAAGSTVTKYLISLGHTKIGCIFKNDDGQGLRRYKGYQNALLAAEIPIEEEHVCWIDTMDLKDMLKRSEWILHRLEDCTACVCYNDEVAYMLTELCAEHKIGIPGKISIVSIDNSRLTQLNSVRLTSVSHPMEELGKKAADNLLKLIGDPQFDATYEFPAKITVRDSAVQVSISS